MLFSTLPPPCYSRQGCIFGVHGAAREQHEHDPSSAVHKSKNNSRSSVTCEMPPGRALAQGCKFDIVSFSWLPEPCYDAELTAEFLALKADGWKWYELLEVPPSDRLRRVDGLSNFGGAGGQLQVPREVSFATVQTGSYPELFVTNEYHFYHCIFAWRKLHRALEGFANMDGYVGSLQHTNHCGQMLSDFWMEPREQASTLVESVIRRKTPECWI